ncbi:MAG: hypothetical protein J6B09_00210 [Clostridia bacterium]|nr:hypothetical protein [Clostridia bacterium]
MNILLWLNQNWELICICFGILVNAVGVAYNIYKLCRGTHAKGAACWLKILEAARVYEIEAEQFQDYTAAEKLQYVLSRLRLLTAELGIPFDEARLSAQIEADIAFSKEVNATKSERLE